MQILTPDEMASTLDFVRPMAKPPETPAGGSSWPIPFEYGPDSAGTRVSVAKARQIIAELAARIAEHERRELYLAFKREEKRCESIAADYSKAMEEKYEMARELAAVRGKLAGANAKLRAKGKGSR